MSDTAPRLSLPKVMDDAFQASLTDEYLTKLEIAPDTVLILRPPKGASTENMVYAMRTIKAIIKEKTGIEPALLIVAQDTELVAMGVETLIMLRNEIDASLQYIHSKFGGPKGN